MFAECQLSGQLVFTATVHVVCNSRTLLVLLLDNQSRLYHHHLSAHLTRYGQQMVLAIW